MLFIVNIFNNCKQKNQKWAHGIEIHSSKISGATAESTSRSCVNEDPASIFQNIFQRQYVQILKIFHNWKRISNFGLPRNSQNYIGLAKVNGPKNSFNSLLHTTSKSITHFSSTRSTTSIIFISFLVLFPSKVLMACW